MEKRTISHTDLTVAPVSFGGNVFGWTLDEKQSFHILDRFADAGFNFIDTADTYSWWVNGKGGQSEEIIGKWMKSRSNRNDIVIATKVGSETREHDFDISKKHILKSVDDSLKRLGTDHIDLYYTHFDDGKTPVEETLEAYDEIIKAGKVRYIGVSNVSPERIRQSFEAAEKHHLPKYIALQPHYNLMEREGFEKDYHPLVEEYGLSVFPYFSLAGGFLTGKYRDESDFDKSARGGGMKKYLNDKGMKVLKALDELSEKHQAGQASIALAWLLANPAVTAPIVSATSDSQLQALFKAVDIKLDEQDMQMLNDSSK